MTTKDNKEKSRTARETLGKYFYDLSKLVFSIMVLGNVVDLFGKNHYGIMNLVSFCLGVFATWALALVGNKILKK